MPTTNTTRTAALRRELARAMDAAETASLPLQRLGKADQAVSDAKMALADFDMISGDAWKDWATSGIGPQPTADAGQRSELVSAVEAAEAMLISARHAAGSFANASNIANHHVSVIAAQLKQATLAVVYEAVEEKISEYIESAQNTARIYGELLGFDKYIYANFKDCNINGRVAGLVHNRDAATDVLIIPGFDIKSLDHRNRFTVNTNPEDIERGRQLAAKATLED